jgi:hypothetical protein
MARRGFRESVGAAALMCIAAVIGVDAERKSLETVARPLSAV